jgi:hypothetical protein
VARPNHITAPVETGRSSRATYDRAVALMNDTSPRYPVFVLLRDEAARLLDG